MKTKLDFLYNIESYIANHTFIIEKSIRLQVTDKPFWRINDILSEVHQKIGMADATLEEMAMKPKYLVYQFLERQKAILTKAGGKIGLTIVIYCRRYYSTCKLATKIVDSNKTSHWLNQKNELHREDGPAIEDVKGNQWWYKNGQLHRNDGPAVSSLRNNSKFWYQHGQLHRENGPAIEHDDGSRFWYQHGKPHRSNGPAVESGTTTYKEYYYKGEKLTESAFFNIGPEYYI